MKIIETKRFNKYWSSPVIFSTNDHTKINENLAIDQYVQPLRRFLLPPFYFYSDICSPLFQCCTRENSQYQMYFLLVHAESTYDPPVQLAGLLSTDH